MRWMLALGAAAACVALGCLSARRLTRREEALSAWQRAFFRMEGAVRQGRSLGDALSLGAMEEPSLTALAEKTRAGFAGTPDEWISALPNETLLPPREWENVQNALRGLFFPTTEQQLKALSLAQTQLKADQTRSRENSEKNGRLYRSLGWLAGAALFILLC